MPSTMPAGRRKDNDVLVNSKDYRYIMATSESDMGSSTSSSTKSRRRPKAHAKKSVLGDNSIKGKDYHYIMDTSASDVSPPSSGSSRRGSVGSSASLTRSCRNSPHGSSTGSEIIKTEASKSQHPADSSIKAKDYHYIMDTSASDVSSSSSSRSHNESVCASALPSRSCRSSPHGSATGSDNVNTQPSKSQHPADSSIKAKDYHYIMDTSASDVSSSSSSRSHNESVCASALPSRSCRSSPHGSATGSDNVNTQPSKKQHLADSSIKAKDYLYVMDTSASDVSSSSSSRSHNESVCASALPSRSCRSSPHGSSTGSEIINTQASKSQHPADSSIKAKDYHYIMDTSASDVSSSSSSRSHNESVCASVLPSRSCRSSPHGSATGSDNVNTQPSKKQHLADSSIKPKDYHYIMDTSASDVSSSSSSRSQNQSVGSSALSSRSCHSSPHGSATGSDNVSTEPPKEQHPADSSIKAKDYLYIMDTSASDLSSSSSSRSHRESVGAPALSSRNSQSSPRGSPTGSAKYSTEPPKKHHPSESSIKAKDYHYIMDTSASDGSSSSSSRSHRESVGAPALSSRTCRSTPRGSVGSSASPPISCQSSPHGSPGGSDKVRRKPPRKQHPGSLKKPDDRSSTSPKSTSDSSSPSLYPRSLTASNHSIWSSEILSSVSSDSESVFNPFMEDHLQPRLSTREPSVDAQFPVAETISEISLVNRSDESWFTVTRESNSFYQEGLHQRKLLLDQAWVTGDRKKSMLDWVSSVHVFEDDGKDKDKTPCREKLQERVQRFISRVCVCGGQSQA
ncbi:dentin sialophosphoprotein-like [Haliotis asinina]|uniref:dentin sialophosphoprotein-like n=1 Tax=Haliotis asinina TaxID=109174 RepID=UPI003531CA2E